MIPRFKFDVKPLDILIPEGVPRTSMIGIMGETGTGKSVLLNEIAYRALKRGESVVFILLEDMPLSRLMNMRSLGFDVLDDIRAGRLRFIDCFSYRLRDKQFEKPPQLMEIEDELLEGVVEVEDPRNPDVVWDHLEKEGRRMIGKGIMLMDSLTECLTISAGPADLLELMKMLKVVITKYYMIPFIYTYHLGFSDEFRYAMELFSDGVIDLRFDPSVIGEMLVKQIRVRRMSGAPHSTRWITIKVDRGGIEPLTRGK